MIILVGSEKGGVGKSTISINIAAELAQRNQDVCLVDADKQGTASRWAQDRVDARFKPVQCISLHDNIHKPLLDLSDRYKILVVDVAGRDSRELRTGMLAADVLVTPFRPSQPDLDTLPHLADVIEQAKDMNPSLICRAVLSMAPTNPRVNEVNQAKDYLKSYPEFVVCDAIVRDRKAFRDSLAEGAGVVEWGDPKATYEVQRLVRELIKGYEDAHR